MGIPPKIMIIFTLILLLFGLQFVSSSAARVLNTTKAVPTGYKKLKTSGKSAFYEVELPPLPKGMAYDSPPYLLDLHGSRREIGYDYAAMLHEEASYTISSFLESVFPKPQDRLLLVAFFDFCRTEFLGPATKKSAPEFLEELAGMDEFFEKKMPSTKSSNCSRNWCTVVMRTVFGANALPNVICTRRAISTLIQTLALIVINWSRTITLPTMVNKFQCILQ